MSRFRRVLRRPAGCAGSGAGGEPDSSRGRRRSCAGITRGRARRTRGCARRTRRRRLSWRSCGPWRWRYCSGWCSAGRRRSRGRSRLAATALAVMRAGTAGTARGRNAARGRGRGGGIIRTCLVSGLSGISRGAGIRCPECGVPFTLLGADHVSEQLDWTVTVRVRADCRRRQRRGCSCRVPATVTAPGPPKAIGKGLFTNGFTAMLLTERFAAGRSMNLLVAGLSRAGCGDLARDFGGDVRAGGGAAGAAGGRDCGAVARVVAPARGRDPRGGCSPRVTGPAG